MAETNNKVVALEYTYMMNPAETWQHLYQFEQDFAKFLEERGFEAEVITNIDGQISQRRLLFIRKRKGIIPMPAPSSPGRPKTPQGLLRDMQEKKINAATRDFATRPLKMKPLKEVK